MATKPTGKRSTLGVLSLGFVAAVLVIALIAIVWPRLRGDGSIRTALHISCGVPVITSPGGDTPPLQPFDISGNDPAVRSWPADDLTGTARPGESGVWYFTSDRGRTLVMKQSQKGFVGFTC